MASALTPEQLNAITGLNPTKYDADSANDNTIENSPVGYVFARIQNNNSSGYSCQVTAVSTKTVTEGSSGNLAVQDPAVVIPGSGGVRVIGPWSANFGDPVTLQWDMELTPTEVVDDTDLDIEVFKIA